MPRHLARPALLSEGQTFLVGPELYLRGVNRDDWQTANAWWPAPFPFALDAGKELIAESLRDDRRNGTQTFIACRRIDDTPLGSLRFWYGELTWGLLRSHVNPLFSDAAAARCHQEMLSLAVPWALHDWGAASITVEFDDSLPGLNDGMQSLGLQFSYRLREALLRRGERHDLVAYEGLNQAAIGKFGLPSEISEGSFARETRLPAGTRLAPDVGELPGYAIVASDRLLLRAVTEEDIPLVTAARMRETETFHDFRWPTSSLLADAAYRNMAKELPPAEILMAIVRRSDAKFLGTNGIFEIDWVNGTAETGTELIWKEDRGSGYGSEAKHLLLDYTFARLGLHMVRSFVWGPNSRSAAALRRQGYRDAGVISWRSMYQGLPVRDYVFDLLASEWFAARQLANAGPSTEVSE